MASCTTYELLAVDLDGTLLGPDHKVSPETKSALRAAAGAGLRVVLATGRSYVETIDVWRQLELPQPHEPLILIGGALVSEADTGRTLSQRCINRELAVEYTTALARQGHSAMAIVDPWRWGVDYLVVESDDADRLHRDWFDKMDVKAVFAKHLDDKAADGVLRIHAVSDGPRAMELAGAMQRDFGDRLNLHAIVAPNYGVTIVEAFAAGTNKWAALQYIAQSHRLGAGKIAAIGDDVNDIPMLQGAGLGAAMPQAADHVRRAADMIIQRDLPTFVTDLTAGKFD